MSASVRGGFTGKDATCHPGRHAFQGTQCRECWQGKRLLRRDLPPKIAGVMQHAQTHWPPRECQHCGASANALRIAGRLAECFQCGYTTHRTQGRQALPRILAERHIIGGAP